MKKFNLLLGILFLTASVIVLNSGSLLCTILFFLCIVVGVAATSGAAKKESVWLFVLTGITTIPINIGLMVNLEKYVDLLMDGVVGKVSGMIVVYACLFSIEELLVGVIGRLIYRNQELDK